MIHDAQNPQIFQKQDGHNIYTIMKTMWPLTYHHNGFIAIHALGHMMYGLFAQVPQLLQRHCDDNRESFHDYMYI